MLRYSNVSRLRQELVAATTHERVTTELRHASPFQACAFYVSSPRLRASGGRIGREQRLKQSVKRCVLARIRTVPFQNRINRGRTKKANQAKVAGGLDAESAQVVQECLS